MAKAMGVPVTVYVTLDATEKKLSGIRAFGATIKKYGKISEDTEIYSREVAKKTGQVFISPYNDVQVVCGQGTVAVELL